MEGSNWSWNNWNGIQWAEQKYSGWEGSCDGHCTFGGAEKSGRWTKLAEIINIQTPKIDKFLDI